MPMNNRHFAFIWFVVLTAVILYAASRSVSGQLQVKSDMLSLLGQDTVFDRKINDSGATQRQKFILMLSGPEQNPVKTATLKLAESLTELEAIKAARTMPMSQELIGQLAQVYHKHPFTLVDGDYLKALQNDQPKQIENQFLSALVSTANPFVGNTFEQDPTLSLAHSLQTKLAGQSRWLHDGQSLYQKLDGQFFYPIFVEMQDGPLGVNQSVLLAQNVNQVIAEQAKDLQAYRSGLLFHVADATKTAQSEITLFSALSTLLILLATILVFRSATPIAAILLIMAVAITFGGAGLVSMVNQMHLLTFIFAISLIGISVDYAFHTLSAAAFGSNKDKTLTQYLAPAMLMGAATTILGYLSMLLMPLAALHQITVFMIFGLCGALATALWWLAPIYSAKKRINFSPAVLRISQNVTDFCLQIRCVRHLMMVAAVLFALFGLMDFGIRFDDNVGNLNSANPALIKQEQKIQQLMGYSGYPRYIVFSGADDQQVLTKMAKVTERLGKDAQALSLANWIPTEQTQQANKAQLKQFIAQGQLSQMASYLDPEQWQQMGADLDNILRPKDWPGSLNFMAQGLWQDNDQSYGLISYYTQLSTIQQRQIKDGLEGVSFIDQPQRLTQSLFEARTSLSTFFLLATLAFTVILVARYGLSQGLFSVLTPLFAALGSLLLSQFWLDSLSIFNLLSCLLIGALAIDYIVFFNEQGHQPHVVLAIFLSALSSMAAFGMMAMSSTPAVQHFGLSTLIGIFLAVLMSLITPLKSKGTP